MKQGEAVYQAVVSVCGESEGAYDPTERETEMVRTILVESFMAGKVDLSKGFGSEAAKREYVTKYVPGLINNWLRKDPRLNGGVKYEAKNPGSRAGSGDPTLKALKLLLATKTDIHEKAEICDAIEKRRAEIESAKRPELTEDQKRKLRELGLAHLI